MKKKISLIAALYIASVSAGNGVSVVVDFNTDQNDVELFAGDGTADSGISIGTPETGPGNNNTQNIQPYGDLYEIQNIATGGITFSSSDNFLTLYDSDGDLGNDRDLEANFNPVDGTGGFLGGNANPEGGLGNVLILQTNINGQVGINDVDNPNDDGNGGVLTIDSAVAFVEFSFSYVDLDNGVVAGSTITLRDRMADESVTISFSDLEGASTSGFRTDDVDFGDDHANNVGAITLAELQNVNTNLTQFDQIVFDTDGSGGLASFTAVLVPEPSSSVMISCGLLSFILRRRRR